MVNQERLDRMRRAMQSERLDALILRLPENVLLLSGFWPMIGATVFVFPLDGPPHTIAPHCYETETSCSVWETNLSHYTYGVLEAGVPGEAILNILSGIAKDKRWSCIGFEERLDVAAPSWNSAEFLLPGEHNRELLREAFPYSKLVDVSALVQRERRTKTEYEKEKLRMGRTKPRSGTAPMRFRPHGACRVAKSLCWNSALWLMVSGPTGPESGSRGKRRKNSLEFLRRSGAPRKRRSARSDPAQRLRKSTKPRAAPFGMRAMPTISRISLVTAWDFVTTSHLPFFHPVHRKSWKRACSLPWSRVFTKRLWVDSGSKTTCSLPGPARKYWERISRPLLEAGYSGKAPVSHEMGKLQGPQGGEH